MHARNAKAEIRYEFDDTPDAGTAMQVAAGAHWVRMPLPFSLNHINLWLFRDGSGFTLMDTGLGDEATRSHWKSLFASTLGNDPLVRVIVTHLHPDHVGSAGFLCEHFDAPLCMTREEYLLCRVLVADTGRTAPEAGVAFYRAAGYAEPALARYRKMFGFFGRHVTALPESYHRLRDGQQLSIDGSLWEVIVGRGHSPEHACLYSPEQNLLVAGDQLLPAISANVSVYPTEPAANPLADWLETLAAMRERIPVDVLVLPAHGRPYRGAHARIDAVIGEHRDRLAAVFALCNQPRRAVDLFAALYRRPITDENLLFATGEAIAHLNYLQARGDIASEYDAEGVLWYRRRC